jgi:hypothetical protein
VKPHNAAVRALEFAPAGDILVTGAADGTVFFLAVTKKSSDVGTIPSFS